MSYVLYILILVAAFVFYVKKQAIMKALGMGVPAAGGAEVGDEAVAKIRQEWGSQVAETAQRAARQGQVQALTGAIARARVGAWDVRFGLCEAGELFSRSTLDTFARAEPQATAWQLLTAANLIAEAWKARGHGSGSGLKERQVEVFHEKLGEAKAILERVAAVDAEDPTPHARLVAIASWQSEEKEVARHHLDQALHRDPDHLGAIRSMNEFLAPHWHGSQEEVRAFGREMSSGAPEGSLRAGAIILSHAVVWHAMHHFDDDANAETIRGYLSQPAVRSEIQAAYQRSVASPQHRVSLWSAWLLNHVAAIATCTQDQATAADAFRRLDRERWMERPWDLLGDSEIAFRKARKWAGVA